MAPDSARWLITEDGLAAVARATAMLDGGADALSVGATLRGSGLRPDRAAVTSEAAFARVRARERWTRADQLLFTRRGLEQASDPAVSAWRARRFAAVGTVVDVAAGLGGDTIAIASVTEHVISVDRDEGRLVLLGHNADVHGVVPSPLLGDARSLPIRAARYLHVDPGRRHGTARARRLADYHPPVAALAEHITAAHGAAIVVSPGVALDDPDLPPGEVEFVQVGRELVEAVVWTRALASGAPRSASILLEDGTTRREAPPTRTRLPTGSVGQWLIEPAAAAVRARLHDDLGAELSAWRVSSSRALLTASERPAWSPWHRAYPVEAELPFRPKKVRAWLRQRDRQQPVELVLHGVQADAGRWWKQLDHPHRGWGGRVIHLIRTEDGATCVVTGPPIGDQDRAEMVPRNGGER